MSKQTFCSVLLILTLAGGNAFATVGVPDKKGGKPGKGGDAAAVAAAAADKPFTDWKKVTKDAEMKKGFLTLYKKRENLYLELKPDQLDKPVLGIFSFARGIGQSRVLGGLPLGDHLMEFHRAGDHILVMEKNMLFTAAAGTPMDKARDLSIGSSVIASLKIESEQDSSKAVLVDLAPFLVSDLTDLAEGIKGALNGKSVRFDKERSALGTIKVFPENDEIEAMLTYSPNDRTNLGLDAVPDERYIPVSVHYSFSKLPDVPMQPRSADDRTGYFLTAMKDFSRDNAENFWVRYVNRWRLEKKDPTAAVSEVVKPIVYYIDRTIPVEYRPAVKKGIENWQKAFEAAGFKNAIIAKDAPDDPNWDPEDVRYSSIRWITSSVPAFGAIGPSRVDPRTGEILDADILVEASIIQSRGNLFRRLSGPEALAEMVTPTLKAVPFIRPELQCDLAAGVSDGAALMAIGRALDGSLPTYKPFPKAFNEEMLTDVIMHEVGHTLGLRHNFRASTSTPIDKLDDPSWTAQHGMTSSVMDYPTPNISPDPKHQGKFFNTEVGDCDLWMIRYGYGSSGSTDAVVDDAFARKVADESNMAGHEYSTDEDTYPADALDPRTNIFDLGGDPLAFAKERSAYVSALWKSDKFLDRIVGPEGDYTQLRRATDVLVGQYGISLGLAVKYIGGQYTSRNHRGQPDMKDPLIPVPAAKQREALDFLGERAFAADAFSMDPRLLNSLVNDRWSHWGMPNNFAPGFRIDYNFNDKAFAIQNALLQRMLAPATLARMRETESHTATPFRMSEYFDRMTKMLWGEVGGASPTAFKALEGPGTRREVQRAYVDQLATLVASPAPGTPDDARALARLQLTRIDARAARVLAAGTPLGDYTRAHLLEARARIKRSLEATLETDQARGPGGFATPATTQ
jgi:Met-zincin/Domain of unknown function (DUF5117)